MGALVDFSDLDRQDAPAASGLVSFDDLIPPAEAPQHAEPGVLAGVSQVAGGVGETLLAKTSAGLAGLANLPIALGRGLLPGHSLSADLQNPDNQVVPAYQPQGEVGQDVSQRIADTEHSIREPVVQGAADAALRAGLPDKGVQFVAGVADNAFTAAEYELGLRGSKFLGTTVPSRLAGRSLSIDDVSGGARPAPEALTGHDESADLLPHLPPASPDVAAAIHDADANAKAAEASYAQAAGGALGPAPDAPRAAAGPSYGPVSAEGAEAVRSYQAAAEGEQAAREQASRAGVGIPSTEGLEPPPTPPSWQEMRAAHVGAAEGYRRLAGSLTGDERAAALQRAATHDALANGPGAIPADRQLPAPAGSRPGVVDAEAYPQPALPAPAPRAALPAPPEPQQLALPAPPDRLIALPGPTAEPIREAVRPGAAERNPAAPGSLNGGNGGLMRAADDYHAVTPGLEPPVRLSKAKVIPERGRLIADAYERMLDVGDAKAEPGYKAKVLSAYRKMVDETMAQYHALVKAGYKFEFYPKGADGKAADPYAGNPSNALRDLRDNKHLYVYPTEEGYGTTGIRPEQRANSPLLGDSGVKWNGQTVLANDVFRAVHDAFGHAKEGNGFRAEGEENAWRSHSQMYSPEARAAMTSETRGQNSWVNHGPHGEANRLASQEKTVYAEQKTGLLPEWAVEDGRTDAPRAPAAKPAKQSAKTPAAKPEPKAQPPVPEKGTAVPAAEPRSETESAKEVPPVEEAGEPVAPADDLAERSLHEALGREQNPAVRSALEKELEAVKEEKRQKAAFGEDNRLVTKDEADAIKARMKAPAKPGRGPRGQRGAVDVGAHSDALKLAIYYVEGGLRKFADFSREMVAALGESVRPFLRDLHERATTHVSLSKQAGPKNADMAKQRAEQGLPEREAPRPLSNAELLARNKPHSEEDWQRIRALAKDVATTGRGTNADEVAKLAHYQTRLNNEHDAALRAAQAARGKDAQEYVRQTSRANALSDEKQTLVKAVESGGTDPARAHQARQMLLENDYSLAGTESKMRDAAGGRRLTPDEMEEITKLADDVRQKQDSLEQHDKKAPLSPTEKRKAVVGGVRKRLSDSIAEVESRIVEQRALKVTPQNRADIDAEVNKLLGMRDRLKKSQADIFGDSKMSDEARDRLARRRYTKTVADIEAKLASGDIDPKARSRGNGSPERVRLAREAERAKARIDKAVALKAFKERRLPARIADRLMDYNRFKYLTSPLSFLKLTGAVLAHLVSRPMHGLAGSALSRVGYKSIFKDVPQEKFSLRGTGTMLAEMRHAPAEGWNMLKHGRTSIEESLGVGKDTDLDVNGPMSTAMGRLHGAFKGGLWRAEFERSRVQQETAARDKGAEPNVDEITARAQDDANHAIFKNNGEISQAWQAMLSRFSPGWRYAANWKVPIKKVPFNILQKAFESSFGFITGNIKVGQALYRGGIEKLSYEEKAVIARHLTRGSVGAAIFAYGAYNNEDFGGYYNADQDVNPNGLKWGEVRIGGHNFAKQWFHSPVMVPAQIGATIMHIGKTLDRKHADLFDHVVTEGADAVMGVLEEQPVIGDMLHLDALRHARTAKKAAYEAMRDEILPIGLRPIAQMLDTDAYGEPIKRAPRDFVETLEESIPGMRDDLPRAKKQ